MSEPTPVLTPGRTAKMKGNHFVRVLIGICDFLIAALVFWKFSRDGSIFENRWWYLGLCAFWVFTGIITRKLTFDRYRKLILAEVAIIYIDVLVYLAIYFITRINGFGIPNADISIWGLPAIAFGELVLFYLCAGLIVRKLPAYYEAEIRPEVVADKAIENGAKLYMSPSLREKTPNISDETFGKLIHLHDQIMSKPWADVQTWMRENKEKIDEYALVLPTNEAGSIALSGPVGHDIVICTERLNNARQLNLFLEKVNSILPEGGCILTHAEPSTTRRRYISEACPPVISHIICALDFIWSRVMPKLTITRPFYFAVTDGKTRNLPRVEILGRLSRAGFNIVNEEQYQGEYYVTGVKVSAPHNYQKPNYGPIIKLRRVGKNGEMINVFKMRSMYAYSEYIQSYAYGILGLQKGGKLKDDFRVTPYGRFIRRCWIDELPMLINLFRGDLKLVGVRPLSRQYFGLYTPEMQDLRTTVKPGLIPPFYAEKIRPVTIEDVQESERRYIEAWHKAHFRTDLSYLWHAFVNIVFRHSRSH